MTNDNPMPAMADDEVTVLGELLGLMADTFDRIDCPAYGRTLRKAVDRLSRLADEKAALKLDKAEQGIKMHDIAEGFLQRAEAAEQRVKSLEAALPLIEAIATWEREHGTVAGILPSEYEGFCRSIAKVAVGCAARAAFAQP